MAILPRRPLAGTCSNIAAAALDVLDGAMRVLSAPVIVTDEVLSELDDTTEFCVFSEIDVVPIVGTAAVVLDVPLAVKTLSVGLATPPVVLEVISPPPAKVPAVTTAL